MASSIKTTDEEWLKEMEVSFPSVNIEREMARAKAWLTTRPGRQFTRRFFVNWLLRCEKPITVTQTAAVKQEQKEWTY